MDNVAAVWTRFLPLPTMLRQRIWEDGVIGDIKAIYSDFGIQFVNSMYTRLLALVVPSSFALSRLCHNRLPRQ